MSRELSTLANWLKERGELFLQVSAPEGVLQQVRTVRSLRELNAIMESIKLPRTSVLIWKDSAAALEHQEPPSSQWIQKHPEAVMRLTAYVQYTDLFTPLHMATISEWLQERGELFLQIELPDTAGNGYYHVIHSLAALHRAVGEVQEPEVEIFIWKSPEHQIPLNRVHARPDQVMYFAVKQKQETVGSEKRGRRTPVRASQGMSNSLAVC